MQRQPDREYHPIVYFSLVVTPSDNIDFVTRIEALVWAVTELLEGLCIKPHFGGRAGISRARARQSTPIYPVDAYHAECSPLCFANLP